jgi:hypothetical protein
MSIRPSSQYRTASALPSDVTYVILGDTSLATVYAAKLYNNFKDTYPIKVISNGNDLSTDTNVESLDYIMVNNKVINKALESERLHLILTANEIISSNLDRRDILFEQYYDYYTGSGALGDMITAYYVPVVGPWFTSDNHSNIENFVKDSTIQKPLTNNEMIAATNIAQLLGLTMSQSIVATKPTILTLNNIFVYNQNGKLERHIFKGLKDGLPRSSVEYINNINDIAIEPIADSCLYTVKYNTYNKNLFNDITTIDNACVLWMDNLYDYVRLLGVSEVAHKKVLQPAFYRMVFAISKVNSTGIDLSNLNPNDYPLNVGDGISTRLTFCCTDVPASVDKPSSNTPIWLVSVYTTDEDFSDPTAGGSYANQSAGKTLLVIEAISLTNRRVLSWDALNQSVSVNLNSNRAELERYNAFLLLCANIYMAYTGSPPPLPSVGVSTVCTVEGICTDTVPLQHSSIRESPLITVMRMMTSLYGGNTYPTPNTNQGPSCCG